jgi:hypothetical protein
MKYNELVLQRQRTPIRKGAAPKAKAPEKAVVYAQVLKADRRRFTFACQKCEVLEACGHRPKLFTHLS